MHAPRRRTVLPAASACRGRAVDPAAWVEPRDVPAGGAHAEQERLPPVLEARMLDVD
jgi:hypothetical protein